MMNVLWITWKDYQHPQAGGAELVAQHLIRRMLKEGHQVTMLTCGYGRAPRQEDLDGLQVIRVGQSRYIHPVQALLYYARRLRNKFDILIEEVNGAAPYFSVFLERKAEKFMFYHQLGRKNWLYEVPQPLSHIGYWLLAPGATRLVSLAKSKVITVSNSTRDVLAQHGFAPQRTSIISEGLANEPLKDLKGITKYAAPTVLSFGALRAMKRTIDHVKAFEIAKEHIPNLRLKIAGGGAGGAYGRRVLAYISQSRYAGDIEYLGRVSDEEKMTLMQRCHITLQTAVEEGWGLTITEAASQGTPAVAYDVDGLRDSIRHQKTGLLTEAAPEALAEGIVKILQDQAAYDRLRQAGWEWSKQITFDRSYQDFKQIVGLA
jgi:glycosyltransferase involved in cell wall biosynthesis